MKKLIFMLALLASFALTTKSFAGYQEGGYSAQTEQSQNNNESVNTETSGTESTSNQNVKNRPFTPAEAANIINNSDKNSVTINF